MHGQEAIEGAVEIFCDVLVVGGGTGGTAAALAAADQGMRVCLIEATDWLGGQLTAQGVCTPDEHEFIETFGATASYQRFRSAVRLHYRSGYRLAPRAAADPRLNPGACWVSRISFEPKAGRAILERMIEPRVRADRLRVCYQTVATACELDKDSRIITAVRARSHAGQEIRFVPGVVLDATDLGDLLPLCGSEGSDWTTGAESQAETGEPDAPQLPNPDQVQPFTFPFALDWSPESAAANVITPPRDYLALRVEQDYQEITSGAITGVLSGEYPWWTYRRFLAAENFADARIAGDVVMVNTAGNDYRGGNLIGPRAGDAAARDALLARARRASLGYLYWLQTECPRDDDPTGRRRGYLEFRLRRDVFDTPDGCSPAPYIRESRRIRSLRPILEQEIVVRDFSGNTCRGERSRAVVMPDSVGIGFYPLDIHPTRRGEQGRYVATQPFQVPLGSLIPVRLRNLLPAAKNLGTTHLTNGAYRLHPTEWAIGEAAGMTASYCAARGLRPHQIASDVTQLRLLQSRLLQRGMPIYWLVDVPPGHPAFTATQMLAVRNIPVSSEADLLFRPDEPITATTWHSWRAAAPNFAPSSFSGTRAQAAILLASCHGT